MYRPREAEAGWSCLTSADPRISILSHVQGSVTGAPHIVASSLSDSTTPSFIRFTISMSFSLIAL